MKKILLFTAVDRTKTHHIRRSPEGGSTMKKVLLFTMVGLFVMAVSGLAQTPVPPVGIYEVEVFDCDSVTGVYLGGAGHLGQGDWLARCFASNEAKGNCNKKNWLIPVTVHASVAQWIDFSMSGTRWDWFVRKPGYYAANCITAKVASNGNVAIDYSGFDSLRSLTYPTGPNTPIGIDYSFGGSITEAVANGWVPAPLLNNDDDLLVENDYWYTNPVGGGTGGNRLHESLTWKLFNRIHVVRCNTACEYQNVALITLVEAGQKPWIEPELGGYKQPLIDWVGVPIP